LDFIEKSALQYIFASGRGGADAMEEGLDCFYGWTAGFEEDGEGVRRGHCVGLKVIGLLPGVGTTAEQEDMDARGVSEAQRRAA
jgi:hypothetical protein